MAKIDPEWADKAAAARDACDLRRLIEDICRPSLRRYGRQWRGFCPNCGEEAFFVNERRGMTHCFACRKSHDALTIVMWVTDSTLSDAVKYVTKFNRTAKVAR